MVSNLIIIFIVVFAWCCCSVYTQRWTLRDPMGCSTPGFLVRHDLPEFVQAHVHWVGDAIQPSHPLALFSCSSNFPSIRVFSSESALCNRWPKYLSFGFSISPSSEYSGLISLHSKGLSRVFSNTTDQNYQFWYVHFSYCHFTSLNLISHISKIRELPYRVTMKIRTNHLLSWIAYLHTKKPRKCRWLIFPSTGALAVTYSHTYMLCNEKIYTGLLEKKKTRVITMIQVWKFNLIKLIFTPNDSCDEIWDWQRIRCLEEVKEISEDRSSLIKGHWNAIRLWDFVKRCWKEGGGPGRSHTSLFHNFLNRRSRHFFSTFCTRETICVVVLLGQVDNYNNFFFFFLSSTLSLSPSLPCLLKGIVPWPTCGNHVAGLGCLFIFASLVVRKCLVNRHFESISVYWMVGWLIEWMNE